MPTLESISNFFSSSICITACQAVSNGLLHPRTVFLYEGLVDIMEANSLIYEDRFFKI